MDRITWGRLAVTKFSSIFSFKEVSHLISLKENTQHNQLRFNSQDSSFAHPMPWIKMIPWFGLRKEESKAVEMFPFVGPQQFGCMKSPQLVCYVTVNKKHSLT